MKKLFLDPKTIEALNKLIDEGQLETEVLEDFRTIVAENVNGSIQAQTAPIPVEYLKPREGGLTISATDGKWNRKEQEKIFTYNVDGDIENWNCVGEEDKPTTATDAKAFDLVKDGRYQQFIPDNNANFFENLTQGLQVFKDNPSLIQEILKQDKRVMIPFVSNSNKDENGKPVRFVASAFEYDGKVELRVNKFTIDVVWNAEDGYVFILPQHVAQKL